MTICNMTIEAGGRAGMIAPDETTFAYLEGRPGAPEGADWERRSTAGASCRTDDGADFDREVEIDAAALVAAGHLGHEPRAWSSPVDRRRSRSRRLRRSGRARRGRARARLHGPRARARRSQEIAARPRLHRLVHERADRGPARGRGGRRRAAGCAATRARDGRPRLGAGEARRPRRRASTEVFRAAGFEWRERGLLDVPGMNPDILAARASAAPRPRTATSRAARARGGRTHLVSPQMAAAAAIAGHFVDIRELVGADRVKPFRSHDRHVSRVLDRADVDTDQIIPKQFLKRIERTGFGEFLFYDWRAATREFELNDPASQDPILVAGRELRLRLLARARRRGRCRTTASRRSSRRRSPTSSSRNCTKIGLLPIVLPAEQVRELMELVDGEHGAELTVDLEEQLIVGPAARRSRSSSTRSSATAC